MSVDLYLSFFGFHERPFTLLPDPDFLYWSRAHVRAFTVLEYGVTTRAPITVITGEVGAGKTTLVQHLLRQIESDTTVALISNAQGDRGDLLRWTLYALGLEPGAGDDYVGMFHQFTDFVVNEYAAGRYVLLVIDEAQNLSLEALEELRMLTNINSNKYELLQIILVGQPELRTHIEHPSLVQFLQRISASFHLRRLDAQETADYIAHRLRHVGGSGDEFSPEAVALVHEESEGIPRIINKLCDFSLVYAAEDQQKRVDIRIVREVLEDNIFIKSPKPKADVLMLENPVSMGRGKAAE